MCKSPNLPRLLRESVVDLKRALQGLHEGPGAKPRERVYGPLGLGKDLYSKWLNTEEMDRMPPLMMFLAIGNITDNPEPLAALARHWGSGYRVLPAEAEPASGVASQQLLADHAGPSGSLSAELSQALRNDGMVDADEANRALDAAQENLLAAQRTVDHLQRIARGQV